MALLNLTYSAGTHGASSKYETKIDIKETSVNISSNTSVVSFTLYTTFSGGSGAWAKAPYGATGYINIAGQRYDFSKLPYDFRSTRKKVWYSGSKTITHNSDGSKKIDTNFYINFDSSYIGTAGATRNGLSLDTIPRTSSFTLSASSLTMGNPMTVTIQPASSSFKHIVYMKYGTRGYTSTINMAAGEKTGSFTPSVDVWAKENITSGSGTATVLVRTYNGTTLIGESTKTFTLVIPSSVKPVANHTLTGVNTLGTSTYVAGISRVKISNSFTGSQGSTLKSYSTVIKVGTTTIQSSNAQSVTSVLLNTPTTDKIKTTITTTVTDSRGRTGVKTSTINVLKYTAPYLKNPKRYRSTATGVADDGGSRMTLGGTAVFTNISGNSGTFKVEYKVKTASTWTLGFNQTGIKGTLTKTETVPAGTETTYSVRITLKDALKTVVYNYEVSSSAVLLDFLASGNGIAIGKSATQRFVFELAREYSMLGGSPTLLGANKNLNNVTDTGMYLQNRTADASTALHYPEEQAGFLEVVSRNIGNNPFILQRYTHYLSRRTWVRTMYTNVWEQWQLISGSIDIKSSILKSNPEGLVVLGAIRTADFITLSMEWTAKSSAWVTLGSVSIPPKLDTIIDVRQGASSDMKNKVINAKIFTNGNIQVYLDSAHGAKVSMSVSYIY